MGFFKKIGKGLKKAAKKVGGSKLLQMATGVIPGGAAAAAAFSAYRSSGEDRRKMALAKKANFKTAVVPTITQVKFSAPKKLGGKLAARVAVPRAGDAVRKRVQADQLVTIKAENIPAQRQKLLMEEWEALGKPGTFREYLLDQVRIGAVG